MTERVLQDILVTLSGKRVLVIGDVMLDEYIWGEVQRISPEAPVPVVEIRRRTFVPGGTANAAANVVSLGGRAWLGGVVGRDHQAATLCETLKQCGIDADGLVSDDTRPTTTKTRIVAHGQQVVRVDTEVRAPLRSELEEAILRWVAHRLTDADACILSDYAKGVVSARVAEECIRMARQGGKPIVVDPKGAQYAKYRGATLITPNVREAEQALHCAIDGDADMENVGQRLVALLAGTAVLITRGSQGMTLFREGSRPVHIPAAARTVFDVTGAGDTVVGMLAMALAAGASLEQAAHLANRAAGHVVSKVGTATVTIQELLRAEAHGFVATREARH